MGWEVKLEPLQRYEVFMAGFCLQAFIIILKVLPFGIWSLTCREAVFTGDLTSEEDLESVHDCITKYRSHLLFSAACYLLGFPLIICHLHYENRKETTILAPLLFTGRNSGLSLLRYLYQASWMMIATIKSIVLPAMLIFTSYYDWEISPEYKYFGYSIQYQLLHLILIIFDSLFVPLGIAASIPWILRITLIFNRNNNPHNDKVIGVFARCQTRGKIIFTAFAIIAILIILFASFGDVFDYDKTGFFSLQGDSQWLWVVIYFMLQLQCMTMMRMGCTLKQRELDVMAAQA